MQKIQIIVILCVLLFLTSCTRAYREHFIAEHSEKSIISSTEAYIPRVDDGIWILPDQQVKENIIESIENAKSRIWIEIYMWTDTDILAAMIRAHNR
jgi:phosphatidylserine/phosphatidylglycerophosphate/cardiolipin synthase-like enzyme